MTKQSVRFAHVFAHVFALVSALAVPAVAQTRLISIATGGAQGDNLSASPALSDRCRYVAFFSEASNLVPNDTNGAYDIFVRDRLMRTTTRVSLDSLGGEANDDSYSPSISGDGRYVAFYSEATNLVAGDTNGLEDCFVHDRATGATTRISVATGGIEGNAASFYPVLAAEGRFVTFQSLSTNLTAGDNNDRTDVFVHDLLLGTTTCVSVDANGVPGNELSDYGAISADGRRVVFISRASNLIAGDTNATTDTFVRDMVAGTTVCVSVNSSGVLGDRGCFYPAISRDGTVVAFETGSTNLDPADTNNVTDIYVRDLASGMLERVSVSSLGVEGNSLSTRPTLSRNGRFVAFKSQASTLVPGDTSTEQDIFWHDRGLGKAVRINVGPGGVEANGRSSQPVISTDGRHVAYYSFASNLVAGDINNVADVFFR